MLADLRPRILRARDDDGFTLVETMVAVIVIGIVMAGATSFMVGGVRATNQQRGHQIATQLANGAIEQVRSVDGSTLLTGRAEGNENSGIPGVAAEFVDSLQWNNVGTGSAVLPLSPTTATVNGTNYQQYWFVGKCWQPQIAATATGGSTLCSGTASGVGTDILYYRVVVAVTWTSNKCAGNICAFITTTLVTAASLDPEFNSTETGTPPAVDNPGNQISSASAAIASIQATAKGGSLPLTWSATNLPAGITVNSAGLITGTPTTPGTYTVALSATDARKLTGTAAFTWTVNAAPTLTNPGTQRSGTSTALSLTMTGAGGATPYKWSATGLPTGLSIDVNTGVVSGTPSTVQTNSVTVTLTDAYNAVATTTFTWQIVPGVVVAAVGNQSSPAGNPIGSVKFTATGGSGGAFTWTATGLPTGLGLNANNGQVNGTPSVKGTFSVTAKATDPTGTAGTYTFSWTVT